MTHKNTRKEDNKSMILEIFYLRYNLYVLYTWKFNISLSIHSYQALMLWSYHTHQFILSCQFYFNLINWHLCLPIASKDDYLEDKMNLDSFVLFWFDAKKKKRGCVIKFLIGFTKLLFAFQWPNVCLTHFCQLNLIEVWTWYKNILTCKTWI